MLRVILLSLPALALLTACGPAEDKRIYFDGATFRSKAKKVDDNLAVFTVEVSKAAQTYAGALQAGEYEGTRYCIKNFGSSRIDWAHRATGAEVNPAQLVGEKGTMVLRGECKI